MTFLILIWTALKDNNLSSIARPRTYSQFPSNYHRSGPSEASYEIELSPST
uniref:Uncharacterized protein n=1 Tax=Utricularia reniformis TaxID=192314 RepID=A0A1Y0B338_9LAMI|nr:hypothetical protein AEK19_MT1620 [Utricularia reniformis]ART31804.1 hypothetical protein AEK19_MT1620 [Utricularia reniformis]